MADEQLPMHAKRKELGESSRQNILDVASRLMAERGYDGTSMSLLCKEVGLPASSIYWHFGNKEGVLAAVMERGAQHFFTAFQDPEWFSGTPSEKLHKVFITTGTSLIEDPEHAQFLQLQLRFRLNREAHRGKTFHDLAESVRTQGIEFMHSWIFKAYSEYGDDTAQRVADELAEFGVALIDGIFISERGGMKSTAATMLDRAASSLVALAEELLAKK